MNFLEMTVDRERGTVTLTVRVQPRASKDELAGTMAGALKVRLRAPALDNRANEALITFLAALLKRPKSAVRIQSGAQSRTKRVEILGVARQQIVDLLQVEA